MPIPMTSRQIADDLITRIRSGEYPPGTMLPSLRELAELYSVSVSTIQRVLIELRGGGYTVGQAGRGTFIADPLPPRRRRPSSKQPGDG